MREARGNLWNFRVNSPNNFACITVNGGVKPNGECVMGRGCAKDARDCFPGFAKKLGDLIKLHGNNVHLFEYERIVAFPTKNNWWEMSDIRLIIRSAQQLAELANSMPDKAFYLARPGCNNGKLNWSEVKPAIENILPDNVIAVTNQ